ncbi:MAG TPA: hypothetical protein VFD66_06425, partial [Verrucomicrobiae bacterium]|nr:hypothetical protein [Verrucomicrobiae bacterium]
MEPDVVSDVAERIGSGRCDRVIETSGIWMCYYDRYFHLKSDFDSTRAASLPCEGPLVRAFFQFSAECSPPVPARNAMFVLSASPGSG